MEGMEAYKSSCFDDRLQFLDDALRMGLEKLLLEARSKDVIKKPYGRPSTPTPFVDSDEEIDDNENDDKTDDQIAFKYDYGFNALLHLSTVLRRMHPKSILDYEIKKQQAVLRLTNRANHAKRQIQTVFGLKKTIKHLRSGVVSGPITSPLTSTSVLCCCRVISTGYLIYQLSHTNDFEDIFSMNQIEIVDALKTMKFIISNLLPDTQYYIRVCVRDIPYANEIITQVNNKVILKDSTSQSLDNDFETEMNVLAEKDTFSFNSPRDDSVVFDHKKSTTLSALSSLFGMEESNRYKFGGIEFNFFASGKFSTLNDSNSHGIAGSMKHTVSTSNLQANKSNNILDKRFSVDGVESTPVAIQLFFIAKNGLESFHEINKVQKHHQSDSEDNGSGEWSWKVPESGYNRSNYKIENSFLCILGDLFSVQASSGGSINVDTNSIRNVTFDELSKNVEKQVKENMNEV